MGSGASSMVPYYVSKIHDVVVHVALTEECQEHLTILKDPLFYIVTSKSSDLFMHLDSIFKTMQRFKPHIVYIYSRPNIYEFVYHIKHYNPRQKIIIDVRSPLLNNSEIAKKKIMASYSQAQLYADHIFACDYAILETYLPKPRKPVSELPIGIDLHHFPTMKNMHTKRLRNFVFVGNLHRRRKISQLIQNFIDLASVFPNTIKLDIYGSGNDESSLNDLIRSHDAKNIVEIKGFIEHDILFTILKKYDAGIAFVPNEIYSVAPSLKSLEYAAAGIFIMASDTIGHRKYNELHGFQFHLFPNEKNEFLSVFKNILNNGIENDIIDINYKAVQKFDWAYIVDTVVHPVLDRLCGHFTNSFDQITAIER